MRLKENQEMNEGNIKKIFEFISIFPRTSFFIYIDPLTEPGRSQWGNFGRNVIMLGNKVPLGIQGMREWAQQQGSFIELLN